MNTGFIITHVMILRGPAMYKEETKLFEKKLYPIEALPEGFTVVPTWGDAFLKYKDDGTLRTACSRWFFWHQGGTWTRWPYRDQISPEDALKEEL